NAFELIASVSSEERPDIVQVNPDGKFSIVLDPLDGSSLVDVNLAVGTIVGIYPGQTPLRPGNEMVAAMYILYGPMTVLVYWAGQGVHEFFLNDKGQYQLLNEDIKIPKGKIFAPGALRKDWLVNHEKFIVDLEEEGYKLRYSGSFVADAHQILHKGGIFTYPGYKGRETGKLRLLFEGNPIGRIIVAAGGAASTGKEDMLSVQPEKLDHRVPFYIGSKESIEKAESYMKGN
ncbi:MAG: class 1 fructose-bisphosphatase, partial [Candidatus Hodarchaeota archaeon]